QRTVQPLKPAKPFQVIRYSIDALVNAFCQASGCSKERAESKPHYDYFRGYFEEIGAKTILVEVDYVDRDYLEDVAGYYVLCFRDYPRKCRRLHFFSSRFKQKDFLDLLIGNRPGFAQELQKCYLGFIVVKPLPATFVGRTCRKTYDEGDEGGR